MTEARVTQTAVEVMEEFVTNMRVTQTPVEVMERFDTTLRVTQAAVEVMFGFHPPTLCAVCSERQNDLAPVPRVDALLRIGIPQNEGTEVGRATGVKPAAGSARSSKPVTGSAKRND